MVLPFPLNLLIDTNNAELQPRLLASSTPPCG